MELLTAEDLSSQKTALFTPYDALITQDSIVPQGYFSGYRNGREKPNRSFWIQKVVCLFQNLNHRCFSISKAKIASTTLSESKRSVSADNTRRLRGPPGHWEHIHTRRALIYSHASLKLNSDRPKSHTTSEK
jgi:hypothetical protein